MKLYIIYNIIKKKVCLMMKKLNLSRDGTIGRIVVCPACQKAVKVQVGKAKSGGPTDIN